MADLTAAYAAAWERNVVLSGADLHERPRTPAPTRQARHTPGGHEHDQSAHAGTGGGGPTDKATKPIDIPRDEALATGYRAMYDLFGTEHIPQEYLDRAGVDMWSQLPKKAEALKMLTEDRLKERLADNEAFQKLTITSYDNLGTEAALIDQWAMTSGDSNPYAIAMQEAVVREFNVENPYRLWEGNSAAVRAAALEQDAPGARTAFVRAMYNETQEQLKARNIDGLYLYRGMGSDTMPAGHEGRLNERVDGAVQLLPMSSWTVDYKMGTAFGTGDKDYGRLQAAWVPAERILGFPGTGYGAYRENEVVVLGGEAEVSEIVWTNHGAEFVQGMVEAEMFPEEARAPRPKRFQFDSPDADLYNADWAKQTWDGLPEIGTPEFDRFLDIYEITFEEFQQLPVYQHQQGKPTSRQARHTPGGHEHDQSTHGKGGGGSEQAGPPALPVPDGPRAGYSEGYDPNKPPADGSNFSRDDSLYWVVAPLDRLRAIRESIGQPGAIGNRMLKAIQESDPADIPLEGVFRGARIREQDIHLYDERGQPYWKQGQTIDLGLTSFTSDRDTAERYITGKWNEVTDGKAGMLRPGDQPVLMVFSSGKAMQMPDTFGTAPDEFVTAGRFEITYVGSKTLFDDSRVMTLGLHQTDTIEVPTVPVKPPEPDYGWLIMPDGSKRPASMGDLWN